MFRIVNMSHTPALGYMEEVASIEMQILYYLQFRHIYVAPNSVVHWRAYNNVGTLPNATSHAICCQQFVDPITGTHHSTHGAILELS